MVKSFGLKTILKMLKCFWVLGKDFTPMLRLRSGYCMAKSSLLKDNSRCEIVSEELEEFYKLIKGHEKLLQAIGEL